MISCSSCLASSQPATSLKVIFGVLSTNTLGLGLPELERGAAAALT